MNYKYVFLILHYQSLDLTNKCIESITEKCADYDYHIVVVDNASPNNSGKALEEKYKNQQREHSRRDAAFYSGLDSSVYGGKQPRKTLY